MLKLNFTATQLVSHFSASAADATAWNFLISVISSVCRRICLPKRRILFSQARIYWDVCVWQAGILQTKRRGTTVRQFCRNERANERARICGSHRLKLLAWFRSGSLIFGKESERAMGRVAWERWKEGGEFAMLSYSFSPFEMGEVGTTNQPKLLYMLSPSSSPPLCRFCPFLLLPCRLSCRHSLMRFQFRRRRRRRLFSLPSHLQMRFLPSPFLTPPSSHIKS